MSWLEDSNNIMVDRKSTWQPGRFLQTLAFFEACGYFNPMVRGLQRIIGGSSSAVPTPVPTPEGPNLFDFSQATEDQVACWGALDDVVMGGVSQSQLTLTEGVGRFTGVVSTDNSGGFASIRTRNVDPPFNLAGFQGLILRVRGDGQRYKFFLRDSPGWDAIAYGYAFNTTPGEWLTITIPFTQLTPVFRAKRQPQAPPLDCARICSLQLMLSKFEYDRDLNPHFKPGSFCLDMATIRAFT